MNTALPFVDKMYIFITNLKSFREPASLRMDDEQETYKMWKVNPRSLYELPMLHVPQIISRCAKP